MIQTADDGVFALSGFAVFFAVGKSDRFAGKDINSRQMLDVDMGLHTAYSSIRSSYDLFYHTESALSQKTFSSIHECVLMLCHRQDMRSGSPL